jgi:hypothetical protein
LDQLRTRIRNIRLKIQPSETFLTQTDIGETSSTKAIQYPPAVIVQENKESLKREVAIKEFR